MKKIFIALVLLASIQGFALWDYKHYNENSNTTFRSNPLFNKVIDPDNVDYRRLNAAVFFVTNEERLKRNLSSLEHSIELEAAAWYHSKRMTELNFFSHYDRDPARRDPVKRTGLAGVANPLPAENIASSSGIKITSGQRLYPIDISKGHLSSRPGGEIIPYHTYLSFADAIVKQWMDSPGHRANILSKDVIQLGCGIYCFRDKSFFSILKCNGTQKFQSHEKIIKKEPSDTVPFEY